MTAPVDPALLRRAARLVIGHQRASAAFLSRRLVVSASTANALMAALEANGIVGPLEGTQSREVLVKSAQMNEVLASLPDGGEQ